MTKSAISCGFGRTYWGNPYWKTSFFVQWRFQCKIDITTELLLQVASRPFTLRSSRKNVTSGLGFSCFSWRFMIWPRRLLKHKVYNPGRSIWQKVKKIWQNLTRPEYFNIFHFLSFQHWSQKWIFGGETGHKAVTPSNSEIFWKCSNFLIFNSFCHSWDN